MMPEDKKFLHPRGIAALISLLSLPVIGFAIIAGINFLSIKPVYAQTPTAPVITQTGVTTSYEPWDIWVRGTNLTSTIKAQLFDTDGVTRWGGDIPTALSGDSTWVSFILPADFPPSRCNINATCTIFVKLLDTNTNLLSNSYPINLPTAANNPLINVTTQYFTSIPWKITVWSGVVGGNLSSNDKAQLFDVDGVTRWGGDLPTVYGEAGIYSYVEVTLPGTSPPSGCNYYFNTCAVFVKLLDTNTGFLSNTLSFVLPLITGATPTPTVTPGGPTPTTIPGSSSAPIPTFTPVVTPPSGSGQYLIDVGTKQSLVINIGAGIAPQIKFKAKLASLRSYPDMYLRLRVKDELAFLNNQNSTPSANTCNNPTLPDRDFYVPVKVTGDVYSPVQQISLSAPSGAQVATVTADGWVILDGVAPGRYYSLYLKGPKTRKSKMVEHFNLQPNQISGQDFDWTATPLDPGDLPDPNNAGNQDCTINSTDWSLLMSRTGTNDPKELAICDVNYDVFCNSLDAVAILDTLSKRPDDDQ